MGEKQVERDDQGKPWERTERETPQAYGAFAMYRDMGPSRSISKAAAAVGKTERVLAGWSMRHAWVARAWAWDQHEEALMLEKRHEAIERMSERHAASAVAAQTKALQRLQALDPEELSPGDVLRYLVEASKLERLSRGVSTERTEISGPAGGPVEMDVVMMQQAHSDTDAAMADRVGGILAVLEQAGVIARLDRPDSHASDGEGNEPGPGAETMPETMPKGTAKKKRGFIALDLDYRNQGGWRFTDLGEE